MASGFDGLVERLLYDAALAGTGGGLISVSHRLVPNINKSRANHFSGLGIKELGNAIREFYSNQRSSKGSHQHVEAEDNLLFSDAPPGDGPIIDDNFIELVWHWVSRNPEVTVEGEFISNAATSNSTGGDDEPATDAGSKLDGYRNQRLCTGEDRVWYAIAGHGIDYKRIPFLEFQALSVIAAQGTKGVLQPDVTKLTGQDKRSLPKRTDNLAKNGYIVKTTVIARGTKTSLLKLKKFAGESDLPEDEGAAPGTAIIQYNLWFDEMMRLLRENGDIMAFEDIRIGLGINKKKFETRALHRCVRRLAKVGCLRKVTARVEAPASQPDADMKSVRSLQLLRDPTDIDRVAFMRSDWQRSKLLDSAQIAQFAASGANEDDEDDMEEAEAVGGEDGEAEDLRRVLHRSPPVWNPDLPFPNFLYNRIKESGIAGTSSSELYEDSVGQFWKRAMDEMLVKLTDLWQFSQPPHLRHLAIVKDTCQRGKQPTFQYRTYENFDKAVVIGDTFWEGVFGPEEKGKGKAKQKKAEAAAVAIPDLDEWGFAKVNHKLFVGQSGAATLEECRRISKPAQGSSSLLAPGSLLGRAPGSGRVSSKKSQTTDRTPKSRATPQKTGSTIRDHFSSKVRSTAASKRTAQQADLDADQNPETVQSSSIADQTPITSTKKTRGGPRKSLRADDAPSLSSPATAETSTRRAIQSVALDGSPLAKKRRQSTKVLPDTGVEHIDAIEENSEQPVTGDKNAYEVTADDPEWLTQPAPSVDVETSVEINPPGSFELKRRTLQPLGRPRKAKIAVFRSSRLRDFSWYVRELPPPSEESAGAKSKRGKAQRNRKSLASSPTHERSPQKPYRAPLVRQTIEDTETPKHGTSIQQQADAPLHSEAVDAAAEATGDANVPDPMDTDTAAVTIPNMDPTLADPTATHSADASLPDMTVHGTGDVEDSVRQYKKAGVTKNIGALHIKRRKIAMDIIQACGGVFPGKGEIWFAFVSIWQKQYKQTPDRHTVDNVMKGLVKGGKLKKLTFFFKTKKGLTVERSIFVEPEIDPNAPKVKALQKRIIDSYPASVLPEEADISPEFRKAAARNTQTTHHAKLAKAATGEVSPTTPSDTAGPKRLPPHYIRDEFPEDATLTVRRTANGVGLGAIDAQLRSIKQNRRMANLKRAGGARMVMPIDFEQQDGVDELTYEQALLQNEQRPTSYIRSAASKRSAARMRGSGPGGRKLPGRILGSKAKRTASSALRVPSTRTKKSLPWDAIGYVASQAAHSFVDPKWMADISQPAPPPRRIERIQWKWVDPTAADWEIQPTDMGSDGEDVDMGNNESASFGLLLPNQVNLVDNNGLDESADVQIAPQTMNDIMNSHMLPSSPDTGSDENEATKFFNEVERVQAWEQHVVKAKQALARGADRPFINYTTPSDVPWPMDHVESLEAPLEEPRTRSSKRVRINDAEESPQAKRRRQAQTKAALPSQQRVYSDADPRRFKKRDRKAAANFGEKEHDRLAKAVALVSVVAGGLSYRRNWLIVAHTMGYQFESEFLRHRWDKVRDQRDPLVKQMQAQIWEPFLDAYDRGDLPRIDYDDLEGTDWPALMDWLENEVLTTSTLDYTKPAAMINKVPDLPMTRADLESNFLLAETTASLNVSREEFFTAVVDKRRRDVAVTSLNGLPLERDSNPNSPEDVNDLLRSWARAIVLTEDSNYDVEEAYKKIRKFGDKILDSTVRDLCAERILQVKKQGRRLPGRNLRLDDANFLPIFKRWSDKQGPEHLFLTRVAKRRADVLDTLRYQDHYELEYSAEDELYVVLTNMVGQGLLQVKSNLPERNDDFGAPFPKLTAWGYSGYNYNVRTFDKTRLRFSIVYEKTDKFTFEHGLRNDVSIPIYPPHYGNEDGHRIPLWVDIHHNLLPRMWEMVSRSVLHLVVFRPGINSTDIEETHKGKIWAWEIDLLMKWMEETGIAERAGPGEEVNGLWKGGWKVGEWWYCALSPDVAKWPALSE